MKKSNWLFVSAIILLLFPAAFKQEEYRSVQPASITGKVSSVPSGRPVRSVWVMVYEDQTLKGRSLTGDDGKYYVSALDNKEYKLLVQRGNSKLFQAVVRLPQDKVFNIQLPE